MKAELFLLSVHEEYSNKHVCRRHWNYDWRGRRGRFPALRMYMKVRKEAFGGLLQSSDGALFRVDDEGYNFFKRYLNNHQIEDICSELDISVKEALEAVELVNNGRGDT